MEKLDKESLDLLAKMLMIELDDQEAEALINDQSLIALSEFVWDLDTEGVEMMHLPFEEKTSYLRDDEEVYVLNRELLLKNAPKTDGEHIEIVQVIDKDE